MSEQSEIKLPQSSGLSTGSDYYNQAYWRKHSYEHQAEIQAIRRLLAGKHFSKALDIGGGYGRLSPTIQEFSDRVILAVDSKTRLSDAQDYLQHNPFIAEQLMKFDRLEFSDNSIDLVIMIKLMHTLTDPTNEFKEIRRILSDEGLAIIEVANYMHIRNRLKYIVRAKKIPLTPIDVRNRKMRRNDQKPFINHNPKTVIKQLAHAGLKVERILSVSNLSAPGLRKTMPEHVMLTIEGILQPALAKTYFGPSIFLLVRRAT